MLLCLAGPHAYGAFAVVIIVGALCYDEHVDHGDLVVLDDKILIQ